MFPEGFVGNLQQFNWFSTSLVKFIFIEEAVFNRYGKLSRLFKDRRQISLVILINFYSSWNHGSSHPEVFCKKVVLRNFTKFTGKHLCQRSFLLISCRPEALLKKSLWHRCFPVNFAKCQRTFFLAENLRWLLLESTI